MLLREDFYSILENTLSDNKAVIGATGRGVKVGNVNRNSTLYANARLNAIMSANPLPSVVDYLKTEYNVSGSFKRRLMVRSYLFAATHFVKSFAGKGVEIDFDKDVDIDEILIYPCNKKIRLFDFGKGVVYTMLKKGFPSLYIDRETAFRLKHKEPFIPQIEQSEQGFYSEKIINGKPLARINDTGLVEKYKKEAFELLISLTKTDEKIDATEYILRLKDECLQQLRQKPVFNDTESIAELFDSFLPSEKGEIVYLVVSHGDFQPGNIWLDNDKNKIVIIDWETVKKRTRFYDHSALYYNLRREGTKQQVVDSIMNSSHIKCFSPLCSSRTVAKVVMAEELAYQVEELISFPEVIGIKEFKHQIEQMKSLKI